MGQNSGFYRPKLPSWLGDKIHFVLFAPVHGDWIGVLNRKNRKNRVFSDFLGFQVFLGDLKTEYLGR